MLDLETYIARSQGIDKVVKAASSFENPSGFETLVSTLIGGRTSVYHPAHSVECRIHFGTFDGYVRCRLAPGPARLPPAQATLKKRADLLPIGYDCRKKAWPLP